MDKDTGKAPDSYLHFLWMIENWRQCWKALVGLACLYVLLTSLGHIGSACFNLIRQHYASVSARVIHFDYTTGEIVLEFNNGRDKPIPIQGIYIAVVPTNNVPMKPLPPDLGRLVSVFDKSYVRVPPYTGIEFGPLSGEGETRGRPIRNVALLTDDIRHVLPLGISTTNFAPQGTSFADICGLYTEGAELLVSLNTSLIDQEGRIRTKDIKLGGYFIGKNHTGLSGAPYPKEIDVLRSAQKAGRSEQREIYSFSGTMEFPHFDDKSYNFIVQNTSSNEMLVRIGKSMEALVPVVFIKKMLSYQCQFAVLLEEGDILPSDFSAWVLSADKGETVMNIPMAFSSTWSNMLVAPNHPGEFTVALPSTNWDLLVGGERWATIYSGTATFRVKEQAWLKLIPPSDASTSLLMSNYNIVVSQDLSTDPTWTAVTNMPSVSADSKTLLIVQNEVTPDFSAFSASIMANRRTTNGPSESLQNSTTP